VGVWSNIRWGGGFFFFFLELSNICWETGLRLGFNMICGVGIIPQRQLFRNCLVLLIGRRLGGKSCAFF